MTSQQRQLSDDDIEFLLDLLDKAAKEVHPELVADENSRAESIRKMRRITNIRLAAIDQAIINLGGSPPTEKYVSPFSKEALEKRWGKEYFDKHWGNVEIRNS
jgi:hypothetical protein